MPFIMFRLLFYSQIVWEESEQRGRLIHWIRNGIRINKSKSLPNPMGHTYGPAVLPLTLRVRKQRSATSPSISISRAPVYSSQLLYCPLMAIWLWVTFTPTLHLIKQTHHRHVQITVTGCQCLCRRRETQTELHMHIHLFFWLLTIECSS